MKIAVINLTGGGISGGYRKYLLNIIPRLSADVNVESLLCVSPESLNADKLFKPISNVKFANCQPFRILHNSADLQLHMCLEEFSPDVIFVPIERFFRFKQVPVVTMIQNMEPFLKNVEGNTVSERFRQWVQYVEGRRAIKKADKVIALSRFVYDFLVVSWGISNEKINLVHHGIALKKNEESCKPNIISEGWQDKFIFTAGSIRPARGLEDLLMAMEHLSLQGEKSVRLVIAGESGYRMVAYQKKLKDRIQNNRLYSKICWAGCLSESEMNWCYKNCKAFVMTSRVESFGQIALEAMAQGCVCISANNPCLPEIFKDAAIFYPPKDEKVLAGVINAVFTGEDNQRKIMSKKAKKRAAEFSWDVCAEKTLAVLVKAVEKK